MSVDQYELYLIRGCQLDVTVRLMKVQDQRNDSRVEETSICYRYCSSEQATICRIFPHRNLSVKMQRG
jgi:hypothetical protein